MAVAESMLDSLDERARLAAAKVLLEADRVNMKREEMATPKQHQHSGMVDVRHQVVEVKRDPNFYRAPALPAPASGAAADGHAPLQNGGLWPTLGENGTGTNGHN